MTRTDDLVAMCFMERWLQDFTSHHPQFTMLHVALLLALSTVCVAGRAAAQSSQTFTSQRLFRGGVTMYGGNVYHSFRIPAIVRTNSGALITIVEGRMNSWHDYGNINLLGRRSLDNGATWSPVFEVEGAGQGSWTNPTLVNDATINAQGRVWLFFNWNSESDTQEIIQESGTWGDRRTYCTYTDDDGLTWSPKVDLTHLVTPRHFKWDAVGPGNGIQMQIAHPGRLIVPAGERNIYSDDHGVHWRYALTRDDSTFESSIVECMDGDLLRNDRASNRSFQYRRYVSRATIETQFPAYQPHQDLECPRCQASMIRYNTSSPHRIIFLNPMSATNRWPMVARISYDDGATWPDSRTIPPPTDPAIYSFGGYSSMAKTADFCIGALIESGTVDPTTGLWIQNRSIEFVKFNLAWITGS